MAFTVIKSAGGVPESPKKCEVLIEAETDLTKIPADLAPGSVAYNASLTLMFMKNVKGAWERIGG